ncbi:g985 [Coccomyxa elongata]
MRHIAGLLEDIRELETWHRDTMRARERLDRRLWMHGYLVVVLYFAGASLVQRFRSLGSTIYIIAQTPSYRVLTLGDGMHLIAFPCEADAATLLEHLGERDSHDGAFVEARPAASLSGAISRLSKDHALCRDDIQDLCWDFTREALAPRLRRPCPEELELMTTTQPVVHAIITSDTDVGMHTLEDAFERMASGGDIDEPEPEGDQQEGDADVQTPVGLGEH